jgi:hypothetical protein
MGMGDGVKSLGGGVARGIREHPALLKQIALVAAPVAAGVAAPFVVSAFTGGPTNLASRGAGVAGVAMGLGGAYMLAHGKGGTGAFALTLGGVAMGVTQISREAHAAGIQIVPGLPGRHKSGGHGNGGDGGSQSEPPAPEAGPRTQVFSGLGSWIDTFDTQRWDDPAGSIQHLKQEGVRTLYLQTARSTDPGLYRPADISAFVEDAHRAGMKIVSWNTPSTVDMAHDEANLRATLNFTSAHGQHFDGYGMDIENYQIANLARRSQNMVELSHFMKRVAPKDLPLAAITVPPFKGTDAAAAPGAGWPNFPYRQIAPLYDEWMPMSYFKLTAKGAPHFPNNEQGVRELFDKDVAYIRHVTSGLRQHPVHIVAEVAAEGPPNDMRGFGDAVHDGRQAGVVNGASLYDDSTTTSSQWNQLQKFDVPGQ